MSLEALIATSIAISSIIISPIIYIYKNVTSRLDKLEQQMHKKMDEEEVRLLLSDKLQPITDDVKEIKDSLNKLIDHLLKIQ